MSSTINTYGTFIYICVYIDLGIYIVYILTMQTERLQYSLVFKKFYKLCFGVSTILD